MLLVEGRELLYLKLLDVDAFLSAAPPGIAQRPGETKLSLALNAGDIALRDMQVDSFMSNPENPETFRYCSIVMASQQPGALANTKPGH